MYCDVMDVKKFILVLLGWICKHWQQSTCISLQDSLDRSSHSVVHMIVMNFKHCICLFFAMPTPDLHVFKWPEIEENSQSNRVRVLSH
jgi:hypothetical protein